jgi:polyhydroxyalkanoate synthesis regulator phasin
MFGKDKEKAPLSPSDKPILGNFTLTAQLPNGRSINVAGYVFEGESKESLDDRLDVLQEVIERQRVRCEIPELEARKEQQVQALDNMRNVLSELETKRQSTALSSQERLTVQNMKTNIKKLNEDIEKGTVAIAEAKKKAGVG